MSTMIAEAITEYLGERCPDFDPLCHTCRVWRQYDVMREATMDNAVYWQKAAAYEWRTREIFDPFDDDVASSQYAEARHNLLALIGDGADGESER